MAALDEKLSRIEDIQIHPTNRLYPSDIDGKRLRAEKRGIFGKAPSEKLTVKTKKFSIYLKSSFLIRELMGSTQILRIHPKRDIISP